MMVHLLNFGHQFLRVVITMSIMGGAFYLLRTSDATPPPLPIGAYDPGLPQNQLLRLQIEHVGTSSWTLANQRQYAELELLRNNPQPLLAYFAAGNPATSNDVPFMKAYARDRLVDDPDRAIELLNQVITVAPTDAEAYYLLGLLLLTDDPAQAEAYLARAATDDDYADRAGQLREGIRAGLVDVHELAQILIDIEEWRFAEELLTLAIANNINDYVSYAYRGHVREQQGRSGLNDLEHALGLAPESPLPYYFLGLRWREIPSERDTALFALNRAYALAPTNAVFAIELAVTLQAFGDLNQAANWYDVAIGLDPENETWHQQRAAFYAETEYARDTDGLLRIREAHLRFPQNDHILASLGYASYLLGSYDDARTHLNAALAIEQDTARTQYFYGLALDALDDLPGAIAAFTRAVTLAGNNASYGSLAQRQLERLRVAP
jgi:tetratricopeptide (TPR) repeat protein